MGILQESVVTLREAAKLFRSREGGGPVHPATVKRWIRFGVQSATGIRTRLEGIRAPGHYVTSHEAIERFVAKLSDHGWTVPPSYGDDDLEDILGPIDHSAAAYAA